MCVGTLAVVTFAGDLRLALKLTESAKVFGYADRLTVLPMSQGQSFWAKVERLQMFARRRCRSSVVLYTDAYDAFFASPASVLLQRFLAMDAELVFTAEKHFVWQQPSAKAYYDLLAARRGANSDYRFLNSGGLIGYAGAIADANITYPKECQGSCVRKGADQMAYSSALAKGMLNASLDHGTRLFFVANADSAEAARERVRSVRPCIVHMPWHERPDRNTTFQLLYQDSMARVATPSPQAPPPPSPSSSPLPAPASGFPWRLVAAIVAAAVAVLCVVQCRRPRSIAAENTSPFFNLIHPPSPNPSQS